MDDAILADRVDVEPPIFKGCSSSELITLLLIAVALWIPLSILIALMIGKVAFALGIIACGVIGTVFVGAGQFQRVKRNRPDHYYVHDARRFLHVKKLRTGPFVWRSGLWDISRG
jgi:conjugative transfer region protein (TIGR03750 family)